ncbi:MAG: PorT family protein [Taibaiella sp.]|nr:PorT family protein [Taibaiella sp.]
MNKRLTVILFLFILSTSALAQSRFSLEAGLVSSNYFGKSGGLGLYTAEKWGLRTGLGADSRIGNHLSLQYGALYVMNGYRQNTVKGDLDFALSTINIPINLVYKFDKPTGNRLYVGAGPYMGFNMFGEKTYTPIDSAAYSWQVDVGDDPRDDIKLFDLGIGLTAGYELKKGWFFHFFYQTGILNMSTNGDSKNILNNKNSGISVGYLFGTGRQRKNNNSAGGFRNNGLEM